MLPTEQYGGGWGVIECYNVIMGGGSKVMKNCFTQLIYDSQRSVKYFIFSVEQFDVCSTSEKYKWGREKYEMKISRFVRILIMTGSN